MCKVLHPSSALLTGHYRALMETLSFDVELMRKQDCRCKEGSEELLSTCDLITEGLSCWI